MKTTSEKLNRELSQSQLKMGGNARVSMSIGCPATPDPSPSVSLRDSREAGEGSGLLDSMKCGAGEKKIKDLRRTTTTWKTPRLAPVGQVLGAGFSTPFPGGRPCFAGPLSHRRSVMQKPERRSGDRRREGRDRLMSETDAATLVGVSPNTIRYWRQIGTLPFVKVGKHPRVWLSVLLGVFQKPQGSGSFDSPRTAGKMVPVGDIRRGS